MAVFTEADIAGFLDPMPIGTPFPAAEPAKHRAVAVDAVRFVGDPAAVVVARDRHAARDAVVVATAPAGGGRPRAEAGRLRPLAASDATASALDSGHDRR